MNRIHPAANRGRIQVARRSRVERQRIDIKIGQASIDCAPTLPFDYEAGWGRFKMDYPAFALVLVEGTPPPERTPQPEVQLATAVIHPDCVTVRLEDGSDPGLSLDLRPEGSGYHFLRRVNSALRSDHQPYVCWRMEWAEDVEVQDFAPLSIANESALVFASSAVWLPEDGQIVAAMVAGPTKEFLTAIRATLANNNSKGWITVKRRRA